MAIFKTNPVTDAEAALAGIERNINKTRDRLVAAEDALQKSQDAKREAMAGEEATFEKAVVIAVKAEREAGDLRSVLDDLEAAKAAAESKLAIARETEEREKQAIRLEQTAANVTAPAQAIDRLAKQLAIEFEKLQAAIGLDFGAFYFRDYERPAGRLEKGTPASAREVVSAVLANAIQNAIPDAFDRGQGEGNRLFAVGDVAGVPTLMRVEPGETYSGAETAKAMVTERLRKVAVAVRSGEAPITAGTQAPWVPEPPRPAPIPEVEMIAIKPFKFVSSNWGVKEMIHTHFKALIPEPVAILAEAQGLAHRIGSAEADALLEELAQYRRHNPAYLFDEPGDFVDFGDPCGFMNEELAA